MSLETLNTLAAALADRNAAAEKLATSQGHTKWCNERLVREAKREVEAKAELAKAEAAYQTALKAANLEPAKK